MYLQSIKIIVNEPMLIFFYHSGCLTTASGFTIIVDAPCFIVSLLILTLFPCFYRHSLYGTLFRFRGSQCHSNSARGCSRKVLVSDYNQGFVQNKRNNYHDTLSSLKISISIHMIVSEIPQKKLILYTEKCFSVN